MRRILVVDDEPTIRKGARMILELEGYDVVVAQDGKEALAALNGKGPKGFPDLVITDWMMPGMNGIVLCQALREDSVYNPVPIVMMSAAPEPVQHSGLYDAFIQKPFTADNLIGLIGRLLELEE